MKRGRSVGERLVVVCGVVALLVGVTTDFLAARTTLQPPAAPAFVKFDPGLDKIVPAGAMVEKVAGGFKFTEGTVWSPQRDLVFSDMNSQTVFRLMRNGEPTEVKKFPVLNWAKKLGRSRGKL